MKVSIIGSGYVGLVTAVCLAHIGHDVLCFDHDADKINTLKRGISPLYEPDLQTLILQSVAQKKLQFTLNAELAATHANLIFLTVGTPGAKGGEVDLEQVYSAVERVGNFIDRYTVIVNKSTVPVGTAEKIEQLIGQSLAARNMSVDFAVISNPEFLREGSAIADFLKPDRILMGAGNKPNDERAVLLLTELYLPIANHTKLYRMTQRSAEFSKYAANAMLATRISFMNELANLADPLGVDIEDVRIAMGSDSRIGPDFLKAGTGYGGSCFPKDIKSLLSTAVKHKHRLRILESVEAVNDEQKSVLVYKLIKRFGSLEGRRFALWGLAFKAQTDDMREAPSRIVLSALVRAGAYVVAHDPAAMKVARQIISRDLSDDPAAWARVNFVDTPEDALNNADALVIMTEWDLYRTFDLSLLNNTMKTSVIFDGRNLFDPNDIRLQGIEYSCVGRTSNIAPSRKVSLLA
ncbi:hypothetical protein ALQ93_200009 [Pseudomonas syringae pv. pisi]|uniref:UDP-glucose 6-dehydrogenase n=1 Tax=Pseudomonas syringae pv. aptata TaxID=83167 RepID=A0A3M5WH92_PSEAP|nr:MULTISPECIES: UDP-glucose/GDP-mannose dehydrogenase family protein [Pseudomonas syringae group]RML55864.1 hypothetical protein ALQ93_200009 [Pseudomonas syringae pv. pisi]RMP62533.1 Nucleotide sugar dehydrogenase [Pseudomonas syringae pv. berberidis]RMU68923.1 Nucleotide sugar dehydrogenase [Pseudomonas syringae pv. aptata]